MLEVKTCPKPQHPLTQAGKHWICPEHSQVSMEEPHAPLCIFLYCAHDRNEDLARRVKADLEKRGYDVWFDKNEIKFGDNWRRALTNGIVGPASRFCLGRSKPPPGVPNVKSKEK